MITAPYNLKKVNFLNKLFTQCYTVSDVDVQLRTNVSMYDAKVTDLYKAVNKKRKEEIVELEDKLNKEIVNLKDMLEIANSKNTSYAEECENLACIIDNNDKMLSELDALLKERDNSIAKLEKQLYQTTVDSLTVQAETEPEGKFVEPVVPVNTKPGTRSLGCGVIKEMREAHKNGVKVNDLAITHGLNVSTVYRIIKLETYKNC